MQGASHNQAAGLRSSPLERSERGADAFVRAQRHSRMVRRLKIVLPTLAVVIMIAFIGYSILASSVGGSVSMGTPSLEGGDLVMANPKLDGFTKDDLPYKMSAARAKQSLGGGNSIELEDIQARLPIDDSNWASINAAAGVFDKDDNTLNITSSVTLETTSGIVARLQSAKVDIAAKKLSTQDPVEIELDGTRIAAESMQATEGGKVLTFSDRVRVQIDPSQIRQESAEAQGGIGE